MTVAAKVHVAKAKARAVAFVGEAEAGITSTSIQDVRLSGHAPTKALAAKMLATHGSKQAATTKAQAEGADDTSQKQQQPGVSASTPRKHSPKHKRRVQNMANASALSAGHQDDIVCMVVCPPTMVATGGADGVMYVACGYCLCALGTLPHS